MLSSGLASFALLVFGTCGCFYAKGSCFSFDPLALPVPSPLVQPPFFTTQHSPSPLTSVCMSSLYCYSIP